MPDDAAPPDGGKPLKPWQIGLAIGFLFAVVQPFNEWLLGRLGLVDTWVAMAVSLPLMCLAGLAMAVVWQRWL